MGKVAILKFNDDGSVTASVTDFTNDAQAQASLREGGTYAFVDVHDISVNGDDVHADEDLGAGKKTAAKKSAAKKSAAKKK